jgi:hypothetical protein
MSSRASGEIAVISINIGKNSFHIVSALPPRTFRLTWHRSSRAWLAIGDGWMSALITYPPR